MELTKSAQNTVLRLWIELTKSAQNTVLRLWIGLTKSAQNTVLRLWIGLTKSAQNTVFEVVDRTDEVSNHTYGKATLTRFEEIFKEYNIAKLLKKRYNVTKSREVWDEARKQVRTSRTLSKK